MVLVLPDTSVLIPYLARRAYVQRVERELSRERLVLCSVVASEILVGARDHIERRRYNAFFALFHRTSLVATPDDGTWIAAASIVSRYRERHGAIEPRDHLNDILILLTALRLSREQQTILVTENDADFKTWLAFVHDRSRLRIETVRR